MITGKETSGKFEVAFIKSIEGVSKWAAYVAMSLVAPWTVLFVVYMVVRKYGIATWEFVEEYTEYWMVIVTCLTLALTLRHGGHIRIEILNQRLPKRANEILEIVITLLGLGVVGVFTQYGVNNLLFAIKSNIHNPGASQALLWPFYMWIPVGYGIFGLALLLHLYHSLVTAIKDWAKPRKQKVLK